MGRGVRNTSKAGAAATAAPATNTAAKPEEPTKSAYQMAVEAGYQGTEEQFNDPEFTGTATLNIPEAKPQAVPQAVKDAEKPKAAAKEAKSEGVNAAFSILAELGFKGTQSDLSAFIKSFKPANDGANGKYTVAKAFKDAVKHLQPGETANSYQPGDDVSHLDAERLAFLVYKQLVTLEASE